jgi:hypothetical protein
MFDWKAAALQVLLVAALAAPACGEAPPPAPTSQPAAITLLGTAVIPPDAADLSGLTDALEDNTPHNRLGSFGSAIAYTGVGDRYLGAADRGPADGAASFRNRFHEFDLILHPGGTPAVEFRLVKTTLLTTVEGGRFIGLAAAIDPADVRGKRLDPEGIRLGPAGTVLISDEYGPSILEFSREGKLIRSLPVPAAFAIAHPIADKEGEIAGNTSGRVTNQGFEGLAVTPDGRKVLAILQSPLIQDGGKRGVNCRLLEVDLVSGRTRQFLLPKGHRKNNFNELLAINDYQFLAIERDSEAGGGAALKAIVMVDINDASDIGAIASLPAQGLPEGVRPASKAMFLNLLDTRFGLVGPRFPEKIEALAFGPDLSDGRHTLLVANDNDFKADEPTSIWVFAIDPSALSGLQRPSFFPPR